MRKYIKVSILNLFLLFIFQLLFSFLDRERKVTYFIENNGQKYFIKEIYSGKDRDINSHYYIQITWNNYNFPFRVEGDFGRKNYIVDKVFSFKNDQYLCMLPVFYHQKVATDILCQKGEQLYFYRSLKNESLELDAFAVSMERFGYDSTPFKAEGLNTEYGISNKNNMDNSHIIVIPSYKGIYSIQSNKVTPVSLFEKDVYSRPIQVLVSKYYMSADYNEKYKFNQFLLIDIMSGKKFEIKSKYSISMNSYIQGVIGNEVYIIDKSNKIQYKVDVKKKTVTICGNTDLGMQYYENGGFINKSIYEGISTELLFVPYQSFVNKDMLVEKYNGIQYTYKRQSDKYNVYLSYKENPHLCIFAFTVDELLRRQYVDDTVYFIEDKDLKIFDSKQGIYSILEYPEFFYNPRLNFWVYEK